MAVAVGVALDPASAPRHDRAVRRPRRRTPRRRSSGRRSSAARDRVDLAEVDAVAGAREVEDGVGARRSPSRRRRRRRRRGPRRRSGRRRRPADQPVAAGAAARLSAPAAAEQPVGSRQPPISVARRRRPPRPGRRRSPPSMRSPPPPASSRSSPPRPISWLSRGRRGEVDGGSRSGWPRRRRRSRRCRRRRRGPSRPRRRSPSAANARSPQRASARRRRRRGRPRPPCLLDPEPGRGDRADLERPAVAATGAQAASAADRQRRAGWRRALAPMPRRGGDRHDDPVSRVVVGGARGAERAAGEAVRVVPDIRVAGRCPGRTFGAGADVGDVGQHLRQRVRREQRARRRAAP